MVYEQEHIETCVSYSKDDYYSQWVDTASYQLTPDYFYSYSYPVDLKSNEQKCYDALDKRCKSIFYEWEHKVELTKKMRKKLSRNAAGTVHVKSDETGSVRGGKGKRHKAPSNRLPQIGLEYLDSLRAELCPIVYSKSPEEPTSWGWDFQYPNIERGLLHLLFVDKHYRNVTNAIKEIFKSPRICNWPLAWNTEFNSIWYESCYYLEPSGRKRADMKAVYTFRSRKRNRSPLEERFGRFNYNISEHARNILETFLRNSITGSPGKEEKETLSEKTGLSIETVTNWFKNKRQRKAKNSSTSSPSSRCSNVSQSSSLDSNISQTPSLVVADNFDPYDLCDQLYPCYLPLNLYDDQLHQMCEPLFAH